MGRWLLENLPVGALLVLFVVGPAVLTALITALLRRRWAAAAEGIYRETGNSLITQMLAIYGFVLAFVIVNQYGNFNQTRVDVQTEALNVEDLYRASLGFEVPAETEMSDAIRRYVRVVIGEEWPLLAEGASSATASEAFNQLYAVMRDYEPGSASSTAFYEAGLSYLHEAHEARHRRLDAAKDSLPPTLGIFLIVGAVACVVSTFLLGLKKDQMLVPAALAGLLGFTLLLSVTLDHPFSGDVAIKSDHFSSGALAPLISSESYP